MAYFDCIVGGSGKGNTLVVTCADDLAGATITCTNGTKTYRKTCPSTAPYEVTFYGLAAGTWTVSAHVSGTTYIITVVITNYEAELGGFNWKTWVNLSQNYTSSDFSDLDDLLSDETAIRELMTIHACVDYLAGIAAESPDVETIIGNDLCAKWINLRDYALDTLYANTIIKGYMDTADKYGYGEWALVGQVPTMTSNTAPYGNVTYSTQTTNYDAYKAFDENYSSVGWCPANTDSFGNAYVAYKFTKPTIITRISGFCYRDTASTCNIALKFRGSNDDGSTWVDLKTDIILNNTLTKYDFDIDNDTAYTMYSVLYMSNAAQQVNAYGGLKFQFYAWAPKGNVPVMTSNTAPYGVASASTEYSSSYAAYMAFDGDENTRWSSSTSATSGNITYKFSNPVCAKKVRVRNGNVREVTYTITGSNDGSTWSNALVTHVHPSGGEEDITLEMNNDNYYLYYRYSFTVASGGDTLWTLQFYGRELSVSVPTMTGYSTPYGAAAARGDFSTYYAWKAFDNSDSTAWSDNVNTLPSYIQYKFPSPMVIKQVLYKWQSGQAFSYKVQASNDGFVSDSHDIHTGTTTAAEATAKIFVANIDNNTPYQYYRFYFVSYPASNNYCNAKEIQFYGLDYSEREFEDGTNKKWLYDHGVELETANTPYGGGSNTYINYESSRLVFGITDGASAIIPNWSVDFTNYNLARAKITNNYNVDKNDLRAMNSSGTYIGALTFTTALLPNNIGFDVSSINQDGKLGICVQGATNTNTNGHTELAELWLE